MSLHFGSITPKVYENFCQESPYDNLQYWQKFDDRFPQLISDPRQDSIHDWFSSRWLERRQLKQIGENSQVLVQAIEPDYILGFIHVTNGSTVVPMFRPKNPSSEVRFTLAKRIWREVNRMQGRR